MEPGQAKQNTAIRIESIIDKIKLDPKLPFETLKRIVEDRDSVTLSIPATELYLVKDWPTAHALFRGRTGQLTFGLDTQGIPHDRFSERLKDVSKANNQKLDIECQKNVWTICESRQERGGDVKVSIAKAEACSFGNYIKFSYAIKAGSVAETTESLNLALRFIKSVILAWHVEKGVCPSESTLSFVEDKAPSIVDVQGRHGQQISVAEAITLGFEKAKIVL